MIVALAVMGMALAICSAVAGQAARFGVDATERPRAARRADAALRLVRDVVGAAAMSPDTLSAFTGTPEEARFRTICQSPRGWMERCTAIVRIDRLAGGSVLVLAMPGTQRLPVPIGDATRLLYLASVFDGGHWLEEWTSGPRPPLAIGVERGTPARRDTLIVRIGQRG
jgi:hypothetical protein